MTQCGHIPTVAHKDNCEVCGGTKDLGSWRMPDEDPKDAITVCAECFADVDKFREWFIDQMQKALETDPDYEQLPDGRWQYVGKEIDDETMQRLQSAGDAGETRSD